MKYIKLYEEFLNEAADYTYLVDVLLNTKPKYEVYYNSSQNVVNIGGVGYSGGSLVTAFNAKNGQSDAIRNNFYYANQDPVETKKQIEKLSKGKISVDTSTNIVKYKVK